MIRVYGHPRSGTHFIAAVIAQNFFNDKEYLKYYSKKSPHKMGHKVKDKDAVYIKRNFDDVAKSIFKIKDRFGLDVNDFETFLSTPYSDMWVPERDFVIKVNNRTKVSYRKNVSAHFRSISMRPREYWDKHLESWRKSCAIVVDYDDFKKDFGASLTKLANDLGLKPISFDRLEEKVGWMPV